MTIEDMECIFGCGDYTSIENWSISTETFLNNIGFAECEPTKEDMLAFDGGTKGYSKFIETGSFEI